MAPKISFRRWFELQIELRGCTEIALRNWLVEQCDKHAAEVTERTIRALVEERHEPRRDLRAALMAVTGLPVTSFLLPPASARTVRDDAPAGTEATPDGAVE